MDYVFVGTESQLIGKATLRQFGTIVKTDEKQAEEWMRGGCALLTSDEYAEFQIKPEQAKRYSLVGAQLNAPPEFKEKLVAVRKRFAEKHAALNKAWLEDSKRTTVERKNQLMTERAQRRAAMFGYMTPVSPDIVPPNGVDVPVINLMPVEKVPS